MNISALSRADLVSELLSPLAYPSASGQSNLCNPTILVAKDDQILSFAERGLV